MEKNRQKAVENSGTIFHPRQRGYLHTSVQSYETASYNNIILKILSNLTVTSLFYLQKLSKEFKLLY